MLDYIDDDAIDDVPDDGPSIAAGFRRGWSHYVGNAELNSLSIASAEMCLQRTWDATAGACATNCVPIADSDFTYTGSELDALNSGVKKVIAAMSGQVDYGATVDGANGAFYARQIGDGVGTCTSASCWSCLRRGAAVFALQGAVWPVAMRSPSDRSVSRFACGAALSTGASIRAFVCGVG